MANRQRSTFGFVKTLMILGASLFLVGFISLVFVVSELGIKTLLLGILIFMIGISTQLFKVTKRKE